MISIWGIFFTEMRQKYDELNNQYEVSCLAAQSLELAKKDVQEMKAVELHRDEQQAFAKAVHALRFEDQEKAPIPADQLLLPRRYEDRRGDLWSTFNVLQENTIKGGQRGFTRDAEGHRRRASTREVRGIDQSKALNRALWTLAEEMARIKGAPLASAA